MRVAVTATDTLSNAGTVTFALTVFTDIVSVAVTVTVTVTVAATAAVAVTFTVTRYRYATVTRSVTIWLRNGSLHVEGVAEVTPGGGHPTTAVVCRSHGDIYIYLHARVNISRHHHVAAAVRC